MTVKELIEQLTQVENQDIEVIIKGTDPTDWTYMNEVECSYETLAVYVEGDGLWERDNDDKDNDEKTLSVFVIDGGMF